MATQHSAMISCEDYTLQFSLDEELGYELLGSRFVIGWEADGLDVMIRLVPDEAGVIVCPQSQADRYQLKHPYRLRVRRVDELAICLFEGARSGSLAIELEANRLASGRVHSLDVIIPLPCHLRPWPLLRECKLYDVTRRAVDVLENRLRSCLAAGDAWPAIPPYFVKHLPPNALQDAFARIGRPSIGRPISSPRHESRPGT